MSTSKVTTASQKTTNLNACLSMPCKNGGTCMSTNYGGYKCNCKFLFSGINCQTRKKFVS